MLDVIIYLAISGFIFQIKDCLKVSVISISN